MGVYYSYTAGYGIAGTYNSWEGNDLPGRLKGKDSEALQNMELPEGLMMDVGGDQMCGPFRWALLVKSTRFRADREDQAVVTALLDPSHDDKLCLYSTAYSLELTSDHVGWHFFCDVS